MLSNILSIFSVIYVCVYVIVYSKFINQINEEITDMEILVANLEVEKTKLENEIKTMSQNLK